MKNLPFFVISRYNEDVNWVDSYTHEYLVYNKGDFIQEDSRIIQVENVGANQKDIFHFIISHYSQLPKLTLFVQAYPFDHCKKETFDKLIKNKTFTAIEDHSHIAEGGGHKKDVDGGYMEINTSWYIASHNSTFGLTCRYSSYEQFMHKYFTNYNTPEWIRFTPGSQYLVPKENIRKYSKKFWESLYDELQGKNPTEGHIIERSLWYIFNGNFEVKEQYK